MEEASKRAAQRAVNQLRMSRRTLRAGAGQVEKPCGPTFFSNFKSMCRLGSANTILTEACLLRVSRLGE